ncbi:hypothetical protein KO507_18770 [Gilvimarinus agarilyticus]|uniref:hypothetical protein n=1 Tax=unclassified Gilvimarinus TaxID=2642066 RepID=UPI001C083212|nr:MULTISPECIES: hypothetical protein [unclassified Gilvimarinus]MBU2887814.1 hypothetical protein [Gilvimarinus agarilyticus]MDO6572453.1 hypothetical protein [Gilvimarinus sp. 2_MG-2023]MDO6746597.1 hypothetical protein [Gilvimarinus sp. 1_MG-2023]
MKIKTLISVNTLAAMLVACGGGDINLNPSSDQVNSNNTTNNITNEAGGGDTPSTDTNPCASYSEAGQTREGTYANGNCTYSAAFVSDVSPLTVDLNIPALENGGLHIFQDSLWVGEDVDASEASTGVRIPQEGEGSVLSIEAGALIAFSSSADYVRIARGSSIIAEGTADAPIVFSSVTDLRDGAATEGDRGLWGGVQINGNGITNKCTDAQRQATSNNVHNCHVTAEGRPATYGGNNNGESSGILNYVQIRYAGYEVVDGSELNGLTLNAVGSGTEIEYVQTYTTLDDGFEMFGGAVDLKNVVAVNVGDDSIDFSEGWVGDIQFALVTHTSGSNRCIEADNTGGDRADNIEPFTKGRISNMTCITSNVGENDGEHPSSKGSSEGPLFREGAHFELYNSIVTSNASGMESNECLELDDTEGPQTIAAAIDGWSVAKSNVVACTEATKAGVDPANGAFDIDAWLASGENTDNVILDENTTGALPAVVIEGLDSNPRAYITAGSMTDGNSNVINVPVYDVTMLANEFEAGAAPALSDSGTSNFFDAVDFIGAVSADNNWVAGWTVGLDD